MARSVERGGGQEARPWKGVAERPPNAERRSRSVSQRSARAAQPSVLELPLSALCRSALCPLIEFYTSPVHPIRLAVRPLSGPESVCDKSAPETIDTFNQPLRPMSAVALIAFDFIKIVCESLLTRLHCIPALSSPPDGRMSLSDAGRCRRR